MSTYLVTGHAGFIGSSLAASLIRSNHRVLGVDSITDYYNQEFKRTNLVNLDNLNGDYQHAQIDINDIRSLEMQFGDTKIDGIFHLAGQPGVRNSWGNEFSSYSVNNIVATQRIFDLAGDSIPVVFASSSSVYGNANSYPVMESDDLKPISPYGLTKKTCEELSRIYQSEFNLISTALRYFTVYGPGQRPDMAFTKICHSLMTGEDFMIHGSGEQIRDFTFVDDAVSGSIAAMNGSRSMVYNVGGGQEISLNAVIKIFEEVSGKKLSVKYKGQQAGDVIKTGADTSLLTEHTSWVSKISITEGIEKQWNWAKSNPSFFVKH